MVQVDAKSGVRASLMVFCLVALLAMTACSRARRTADRACCPPEPVCCPDEPTPPPCERPPEAKPGEASQRAVEVFDLLGYELELISRQVLGDDATLPVEDEAAYRWNGLDPHPVALRSFGEVLVLDDLQLHQPRHDEPKQQDREYARQYHACDEQAPFRMVVLDRGQQVQINSRSVRGNANPTGTSTGSAR